jgi:hypothetical protein
MGMSLEITEEIIARQPPEAQAIIRLLLAEIARLEARIGELEHGRKTPQNSSLPPSSVHPHAKPASPKRKSQKKRGGQVKRLGHDLMRPTRKLFAAWARYRDGTLTRVGMKRLMIPIRAEIEALLLRGAFSGNERLLGMCNELYDHRQWLWTFLDHADVELTNNGGERALRHAVIWRKLSFGTQSASGSRFVETMLTVIETCRQQRRNTFTFVADAVHAHFAGHAAISLAGA